MMPAVLLLMLAAATAATVPPSLPAPTRLTVEHLHAPSRVGGLLTISAVRPRFSFLPHAQHAHPGAGVEMGAYRIVVQPSAPAVPGTAPAVDEGSSSGGWDSGVVPASAAVGVRCGVDLSTMTSYSWTAQWWAKGATTPSPTSSANFTVGPGPTAADWKGSQWVGEGHTEFKLEFAAADRLFVAAPGGSVVYVDGQAVTDECGVSAWIDFKANLPYIGVDLRPFVASTGALPGEPAAKHSVVVKVGSGFYSKSKWRAGGRAAGSTAIGGTGTTAARLLLVDADGTPAEATLTGRVGGAVSVDPFVGGIFDLTLDADAGWEPARVVPDTSAVQLDGPLRAFAVPPAETAPDAAEALRSTVVSVTAVPPAPAPTRCCEACDQTTNPNMTKCHSAEATAHDDSCCDPTTPPQQRWHYAFDRNIVGMAAISADAYSLSCGSEPGCTGSITVQYCEVFNDTAYTAARTPGIPAPVWDRLCEPLAYLSVVADTFIIGPNTTGVLRPSFTWHGFQHALVSVSPTVSFRGAPDSLTAQWTAMSAEATGSISFGGGASAALLNKIAGITQAGQLSNIAAFVETDCPTREKHAWLGDGMDVGEEAMYNFWVVPIYELFLDTIRAEQSNTTGNLPVNVPAGTPGRPMDISWTAAYPLIAHWLYWYYGDVGVVEEHWPTLKKFVDGQRAQMEPASAVPNYFNFGDWCAIESRAVCTPNTGPPAAAANFILSVEAMAAMAGVLGESADQARYTSWLAGYRKDYDKTYYNDALVSYGKTALEIQTMSTVSIGAGAVPAAKEPSVRAALVADIQSRGNHLTVGATGQKWLLRTLSAGGAAGHDVALAVASQDSYPGWGYWVGQGATTCWESWKGVQDPSHPGVHGRPINPPTHNHIFLCGGVGEWMYRSLGGISPASAGYATVKIAPQISPTLDPASVNASVSTVRGVVTSSWTRHDGASCAGNRARLLSVRVAVPVGMLARVHVPLLGRAPSAVSIDEVSGSGPPVHIWGGRGGQASAAWLRGRPSAQDAAVVVSTAAAELEFVVHEAC